MTERVCLSDWPKLLRPSMRVFLPAGPSEPTALLEALAAQPEAAAGVTFCGAFIPGANRRDFTLLTDTTYTELHFLYPDLAEGAKTGRTRFLPLGYRAIWERYRFGPNFDLAVAHLSPADGGGRHSLGVNADFSGAAIANAKTVIGLVNPAMPAPADCPTVPGTALTYLIEHETPLVDAPEGEPSADTIAVAEKVCELVGDGDTLEFGIGQIQTATLGALTNHKNLKIHTGMVSDPVLRLLEAGALEDAPGTVLTGCALGSKRLYDRAGRDLSFAFRPVDETHEFEVLRRLKNFVAVNSVLEVDLLGQANAEFLGPRQISGQGGLADFIRGARYAENGRGIVAFPATAKNGTVSRIVPRLVSPATLSRYEVDYVVTEHGHVSLKGLDTQARARALIGIAAPQHREPLERAWRDMAC